MESAKWLSEIVIPAELRAKSEDDHPPPTPTKTPTYRVFEDMVREMPINPKKVLLEVPPHVEGKEYTREEVERRTRGQRDNPEWTKFRYGRVTASVCKHIIAAFSDPTLQSAHTRMAHLAHDLLCFLDGEVYQTAVQWSIQHKPVAMAAYKKTLPPAYIVQEDCGLYIHDTHDWAVCSPDGIVTVPQGYRRGVNGTPTWKDGSGIPPEQYLVEIKCPFPQCDANAFDDPFFYLKMSDNGTFELDTTHRQGEEYYWQIQLSLAILDMKKCHLFVWSPHAQATVVVERVDAHERAKMWSTLEHFYDNYMRPAVGEKEYRKVR
jgi:hypothetical protein